MGAPAAYVAHRKRTAHVGFLDGLVITAWVLSLLIFISQSEPIRAGSPDVSQIFGAVCAGLALFWTTAWLVIRTAVTAAIRDTSRE